MNSVGTWRLAPAYDLTYSSAPGGEHYLDVEGDGRAPPRNQARALGKRQRYDKAAVDRVIDHEGRIFLVEEHQNEFLALHLLDHLKAHREISEDRVVLVADDGGYPREFMDSDPRLAALIRKDAARSRMLTVLAKWRDIDHLFASITGAPMHELI